MENLEQSETLGLVESSSQNNKIEDPNLSKIVMNEVALGEEMMESSDSQHKDLEMMDVDKKSLAVQNGSALYRLCVDESRFVPCFSSLWEKRNEMVNSMRDGNLLPQQFLTGTDLAKIGIACREFQRLSLNDELWKQKFVEEFGSSAIATGGLNWKVKFAREWEARKKIRGEAARLHSQRFYHRLPRILRDPNPLGVPGVIGGDYDRYPAFGFGSSLAQPRFFLPQRPGQTGPRFRMGGVKDTK
ncbi:hypothetical protein RJ641_019163 [Dillenia turbinata]|uniref:Uncharacterized protein n=1 Tax=Dillenia turbinata TaxID=194707 RepID=A0AAN8UVN3_9MAGN